MFNYAKREGISMREPDLRHHSEESPTVELEQGLFWGDQSVDYLRGPKPIVGAVLILGTA
jgi:hypothetical protein